MISRSHLRNDATIRFVFRLRGHFAREQFVPAQNGDSRLVAGSFDREDGHKAL
jgi:hypothetical protein